MTELEYLYQQINILENIPVQMRDANAIGGPILTVIANLKRLCELTENAAQQQTEPVQQEEPAEETESPNLHVVEDKEE